MQIVLKRNSLTHQAIFLFSGNVVTQAIALMVPIVLVRVFPKNEYGLYRQIMLIFVTLLPLGQMGVTQGLYYFLPRQPEYKNAILTHTLLFVVAAGLFFFVGLAFGTSHIASFMNNPRLAEYLPLLGTYLAFMIISSFLETSMIAEGDAHLASVTRVVSEALRSITVIVMALLTRNIYSILLVLILFAGTRTLFQWLYLKKRYRLSIHDLNWSLWKKQIKYSLPIGLGNVAWLLQTKLHNFFVTFFFNAKVFATYSIGTFSLPFVGLITTSVGNIMVPALSLREKEGTTQQIIQTWYNATRKMYSLLLPIFVFFFAMANEFIIGLFTESYSASIPVFRISLLGILIAGINTGAVLNAYAQTGYQMRLAFIRLPVAVVVLYFCTKIFGALGTVAGDVLISFAFRIVVLKKVGDVIGLHFKETIEWKRIGLILLISICAMVPVWVFKNFFKEVQPTLLLVFSAFLYFTVYLAINLKFKVADLSYMTPYFEKLRWKIKQCW